MAEGRKYDYPPLLAPGAHYLSLPEVKSLVVDRFSAGYQSARLKLYQQLEEFIQLLLTNNILGDLAIDGSFLTEKPNPNDVDVLLTYDFDISTSLSQIQNDLIDQINTSYLFENVDSLAIVRYPRDHPLFGSAIDVATMSNHYGIENSEAWTKGYVVFRLWETKIGCRIRS
ncbi:hypothetical protein [Ciceribacter sp. L1K22]|uniref:DUF6932 family protein n=1 Tax=Ciceribacter sp. L1K22 TaxID=2820275 RepID=UPI001ABEB321|nr:hypothetical protein [Ciceribacter sp. L1K22]MBO3759467.1 hypothetical protein [Ciceribacter sp. L1K22]